jgi:hypothetical protein
MHLDAVENTHRCIAEVERGLYYIAKYANRLDALAREDEDRNLRVAII